MLRGIIFSTFVKHMKYLHTFFEKDADQWGSKAVISTIYFGNFVDPNADWNQATRFHTNTSKPSQEIIAEYNNVFALDIVNGNFIYF
jgi:hypothetical protein